LPITKARIFIKTNIDASRDPAEKMGLATQLSRYNGSGNLESLAHIPNMMQDIANWALDTATRRGASYADARVMDIRLRELSTKNGEVGTLAESESLGIGIRVIANGSGILFHRPPHP
jgi:hypothetical protein